MSLFERPKHARNNSPLDRKHLGERTGESQQRYSCLHDCLPTDLNPFPQKSEMHEAPQVLCVLRLLKNVMDPPANANEPPRWLPTFTTLILLHALRVIFYPSTACFLLQRPELDVSGMPMSFGTLTAAQTVGRRDEAGC